MLPVLNDTNLLKEKMLFALVAARDEQAFTQLFHTYYPVLCQTALRYLKNEFWAEEVVQEVFTVLWLSEEKLLAVRNPGGWLHRLVWNKSVDRIRHHQAELKAQYALQIIATTETDPESAREQEKVHSCLKEAVEQLPSQRQSVYRLRYHEKLSLNEIAQQLNLTRNTVRNHLSLAVENIRMHMLRHTDLLSLGWILLYVSY